MKQAVLVQQARHQEWWSNAFAEGLRKHGWNTQITRSPARCDLLVLWGTRNVASIRHQTQFYQGEVCILERGYVGDRKEWTSVSFGGGLNNKGIFRGPFHDGSRWREHFSHLMQPWREVPGGYALILGQVPSDMSVKDVNLPAFYAKAAAAFRAKGFVVKFRPHPVYPRAGCEGVESIGGDLASALSQAAVAISWNSNSSVDAVLAGVPSVTMDKGAMAWTVSGHALEFPPTPDRTEWAHWLAWTQYTEAEMKSGFAWEMIQEGKSCEQAA
jgi:hypothetical protein